MITQQCANMKVCKGTKQNLILSKRTKMRFSKSEIEILSKFIEDNSNSAFKIIKLNTNVHRDTVLRIIERGWSEMNPGLKIRDFINKLN